MEIDVSGTVCPQPVQIVRRCLVELEAGEELLVTGDYPPAERSIRRTCYKHGYPVKTETASEDGSEEEFTLRIRVPESPTESAPLGRGH